MPGSQVIAAPGPSTLFTLPVIALFSFRRQRVDRSA